MILTAQGERKPGYSVLSLFTGAGGLDLGFEAEGFEHVQGIDIDPWSVATVAANRPEWLVTEGDVRDYYPNPAMHPDVLLAGFPCQGFSLGGNRNHDDERNLLYKEVIRVAAATKPRVVVVENVLNLRTMRAPTTNRPFAEQISSEMAEIGYSVVSGVFKVCHYGVPQTRRRFVFVAFRGETPLHYHLPPPGPVTTIREFLYDFGQGKVPALPNHDPQWGFKSAVHVETGRPFDLDEDAVPVRLSRTASDGFPIRTFDEPFPAVDTATIWGWAQGHVKAARYEKDRANGVHIRNPDATITLWRISASRLRAFTHREYARLQTFPDDWVFIGRNKRDVHLQVGNAVPVNFARRIAKNIRRSLEALDSGVALSVVDEAVPHTLALL